MLAHTLTFGPRFPVLVLPRKGEHAAYRLSWFASEAHGDLTAAKLYQLLQSLDRERAASLRDHRFRTIYLAVLDDLRERFPLDGWVGSREYVQEISEDELPYAAEGIPIRVMGTDIYEMQSPACLVIPFLLQRASLENEDDDPDPVWRAQDSLDPHRAWLLGYLREGVGNRFRIPRLPRGREWLPPWGALAELVAYAHCETGYRWLDYTTLMLEESGELPPLNLAEIRDLERDWRAAKPTFERIKALAMYLERGSPSRQRKQLERMVQVLLGDKPALLQITRERGAHAA